jgi:hypothetical protein
LALQGEELKLCEKAHSDRSLAGDKARWDVGRVCSMDECGIVILLIDTCGALGSVALVEGGGDEARVVARESLPEREASAALLPAVGRLMAGRALPVEAGGVGGCGGVFYRRHGLAGDGNADSLRE